MNLLATTIISIVILLIAVFILGFRIFLFKDGKFPNIHIGGSQAMKERGVSCATTQDANARKNKPKIDVSKIIQEIEK